MAKIADKNVAREIHVAQNFEGQRLTMYQISAGRYMRRPRPRQASSGVNQCHMGVGTKRIVHS